MIVRWRQASGAAQQCYGQVAGTPRQHVNLSLQRQACLLGAHLDPVAHICRNGGYNKAIVRYKILAAIKNALDLAQLQRLAGQNVLIVTILFLLLLLLLHMDRMTHNIRLLVCRLDVIPDGLLVKQRQVALKVKLLVQQRIIGLAAKRLLLLQPHAALPTHAITPLALAVAIAIAICMPVAIKRVRVEAAAIAIALAIAIAIAIAGRRLGIESTIGVAIVIADDVNGSAAASCLGAAAAAIGAAAAVALQVVAAAGCCCCCIVGRAAQLYLHLGRNHVAKESGHAVRRRRHRLLCTGCT